MMPSFLNFFTTTNSYQIGNWGNKIDAKMYSTTDMTIEGGKFYDKIQ